MPPQWLKRGIIALIGFFSVVLMFWYFGSLKPRIPYPGYMPNPGGSQDRLPGHSKALIVNLPGYGTFKGVQISASTKAKNASHSSVDEWLGIEYATQPTGKARFKAVTLPTPFDGIKDASSPGPACWQNVYGSQHQSESCLTINIYRPSGVSIQQKLPILVYLHGGSFVMGSHRSFDGALFVRKSSQPLMVITVQYRLGALGSLPADFMSERGLLNLGLRDQRTALEFINKYATYFGGDAERVTLGGQSAGAHSVGIHLFHNYGDDVDQPLFHQVILASGSPTARAFPGTDYQLYQNQVEQFMDYINCPLSPASNALSCLRKSEIDDLQFISSALYNAHNYNLTWPWQPVSPGELFEKRGSQSGKDKTFFKIPTLISSTTDEGKGFAPDDLRSDAQFLDYWKNLVPGLTSQDLADLERLYPAPQVEEVFKENFVSLQFERISASYGDYSYICPVQDAANLLATNGAPVYKARFNTPNWAPLYLGVPHASDSAYFNGEEGAQYPEISELYSAYWASFVVSGDPNMHRGEGSVKWEKYSGAGGRQLAISKPSEGGPRMEDERDVSRMEQCAWWRDSERAERLNK